MTFLHPWAIVMGVLAAGVPTAIHFLTRPRPLRMPLSTLRFVQDAVRQRRSWHRFRDILLLALRTLAVLMIALAVARPQWGNRSLISDVQAGDAVRIVILDVSQSMGAADGAVEQIERARTMAANYLRYRPGLAANLIVAGARSEAIFDGPSTNFEALREELARCRALPQRLDVARALDLSARMLAPASAGDRRRRELVVVSDFQRSNWTKADFSVLPADTQIQLESTAPAKTLPNFAILRVEGQTARSTSGNVQLEIEVGNYSPLARKVSVEVVLGDASRRISGMCPAGQSTTLTEEIDIRGAGWQSGEARLVGIDDALGADNVYPFVIHVRPKPTYAILTRQPATQRPSSSHFLECALVPDGQMKEKASATVLRLDPSAADQAALAPADLILLDHPGRLSDETGRLLAGLMRRGRPILYVASELIDATNLKKLSELAGSGLQMPIEF
ncbi:MAG: BatA and WFA domain-containing protein, partial [Thermoguttaceae bacterium]